MKKQKNENVSYLSEVLDKLKEHKMAMAGLVVLIVEILMVVFLPMILKLDPYTSDYTAFSAAPGGAHILGTDAIGRDVFARLMYGGSVRRRACRPSCGRRTKRKRAVASVKQLSSGHSAVPARAR